MTTGIATVVDDRFLFVKNRILEIGKVAANLILEAGALLTEYKNQAYWREDGHASFDIAIDAMQSAGQIDFGSRQARNLIAVLEMFNKLGIPEADRQQLGMSKLREIASIRDEKEQRRLLGEARDMSVADVQREAKRIRDLAAGRDVDPLAPITILATETQHAFFSQCLAAARQEYSIDDNVPAAAVLIDAIMAEWHSGLEHRPEAVT